jgi:hypothetical protein
MSYSKEQLLAMTTNERLYNIKKLDSFYEARNRGDLEEMRKILESVYVGELAIAYLKPLITFGFVTPLVKECRWKAFTRLGLTGRGAGSSAGPMIKLSKLLALSALSVAAPLAANLVVEPTFEGKMELSEAVIIGTVKAVNRGGRHGAGSSATLSVLKAFKGESGDTIVVGTYHPVDEMNPRCCELGATYLMFLRHSVRNGQLVSIRGVFGMIRIGGPRSDYRVIRK